LTDSSLAPSPTARPVVQAGSVRAWAPPERPLAPKRGTLKRAVLGLDAWMREQQGILELNTSPTCILRVVMIRAEYDTRLSDGAVIRRGDRIVDLHFWNERMPKTSAGQGLGWGGRFGRQLRRSFVDLAAAIDSDPRLAGAVAVRGRLAFAGARNRDEMQRFGQWFGFESAAETGSLPLGRRLHDAAEDIWLLILTWTFNPGCLATRQMVRRREDLWISKAKLVERYADQPAKRCRSA
jgi:hypothetical protein